MIYNGVFGYTFKLGPYVWGGWDEQSSKGGGVWVMDCSRAMWWSGIINWGNRMFGGKWVGHGCGHWWWHNG